MWAFISETPTLYKRRNNLLYLSIPVAGEYGVVVSAETTPVPFIKIWNLVPDESSHCYFISQSYYNQTITGRASTSVQTMAEARPNRLSPCTWAVQATWRTAETTIRLSGDWEYLRHQKPMLMILIILKRQTISWFCLPPTHWSLALPTMAIGMNGVISVWHGVPKSIST